MILLVSEAQYTTQVQKKSSKNAQEVSSQLETVGSNSAILLAYTDLKGKYRHVIGSDQSEGEWWGWG